MSGLTQPQAICLDAIERLTINGVAPTYSEITSATGISSKSRVCVLVGQLEQRGYVRRLPNRARSLEVVRSRSPLARYSTAELISELDRRGAL